MTAPLVIWTVYFNPKDAPGMYVIRKFLNDKPTLEAYQGSDVEAIREWFRKQGLICIPRSPSDDPVIVECWL